MYHDTRVSISICTPFIYCIYIYIIWCTVYYILEPRHPFSKSPKKKLTRSHQWLFPGPSRKPKKRWSSLENPKIWGTVMLDRSRLSLLHPRTKRKNLWKKGWKGMVSSLEDPSSLQAVWKGVKLCPKIFGDPTTNIWCRTKIIHVLHFFWGMALILSQDIPWCLAFGRVIWENNKCQVSHHTLPRGEQCHCTADVIGRQSGWRGTSCRWNVLGHPLNMKSHLFYELLSINYIPHFLIIYSNYLTCFKWNKHIQSLSPMHWYQINPNEIQIPSVGILFLKPIQNMWTKTIDPSASVDRGDPLRPASTSQVGWRLSMVCFMSSDPKKLYPPWN